MGKRVFKEVVFNYEKRMSLLPQLRIAYLFQDFCGTWLNK